MERLLSHLPAIDAPLELYARVMARIEGAIIRRARLRLALAFSTGCASALALIPTSRFMISALSTSGFGHYLSLAVSDPDIVFASLQTFALSLAESLPLMALLALFGTLLVLLVSLRSALIQFPSARKSLSSLAA